MDSVVRRLEQDLARTRDRLQVTVEQHETSVEELRASNEELQAINEELRSASEELETSKEELQSLNEELTTVNHELTDKVDELSHSNSDLQNLMASTDIGTMFVDRSLNIKFYTPGLRGLFNIIPSDLGRPFAHLTHKFAYDRLGEDASEVIETLRTLEREVRTTDEQHYLVRLAPYHTLEDHIDGVVLSFVDVSDLTGSEAALRVSEERLKLLIESAKDFAIFSTDTERRVTFWNTGAQKIFGYSDSEIMGLSADLLFTPEDRERGDAEREIETAKEKGHAGNERWHIRKDQSRFYGSGAVTPMYDREGTLLGFVKIMRDLTEQKQMTDALQASQQALQAANKRKDEFLAVLAHELRNPLSPIRTSLEIMKRTKDEEIDKEARAIIERQVQQMVRLVDDLLDISRITRGKINLRKERVTLSEVLGLALEGSRSLIEAKKHEFTVSLPSEPIELEADKTRLSQVFLNLLNNAAKYTDPGGKISLTAELEPTNANNSQIAVRVKDTGLGIPPERLPQLFELFTRLERDVSREGLGIGLSLVKQLVEMHGGSVEAFSAGEGQGSEFTVRLPVSSEEDRQKKTSHGEARQEEAAKADDENPARGTTRLEEKITSSRRVLVIDDYEPNRKTVARLLRMMGHEVAAAGGGEEGLKLLETFQADVILLDLNMPGMNGFEAARRIRERPDSQKVTLVALTGYGQEEDKERTARAGFDDHLVKPVDVGQLETILASLVDPHHAP